MYDDLAAKGLFVKNADGSPYVTQFWDGLGSYLDFTNPEAFAFWHDQVTEKLLQNGMDATWNDNNEFDIQDPTAVGFGGKAAPAAHIRPALTYLMVLSSYQAQMEMRPAERPFLSTRSAGIGLRRLAQTWSGDNYTSFHDLRYCHYVGMTLSLSGFYFYGHDLGGFSGEMPSKELLLRWIQHGVFEPRFTIHSWNADGSATMPWSYPEVMDSVHALFDQRKALLPYYYSTAYRSVQEELPLQAAELVAAAYCFGEVGCALAVVELPDAGLAAVLPQMPVCAVTAVGPDGVSRSVERLAALAGGVMRKESICVTAPEQPKAVLSELVVAAGKCGCELVVPDPEDITFLEAEQFASRVDYGGYTVPLAFLGRHAAGNAAMAVELALALCRKEVDISDEAILDGIAAVDNRCSIRVLSQRPLVILDACRTPQQAAALLRVLNMAKVRHMSAIIGLTEEEGAEAFFSALETGLSPEEQKKDKSTMPGMSESPFDKVYLVTPAGVEEQLTRRLTEKAKYHFDAQLCTSLDEAVQLAHANTRRGLLVCGSEAAALEAAALLAKA